MAKAKGKLKKPVKPTIKKTRKIVVEPLYIFGYEPGSKTFIMNSFHGGTENNLARLSRLLRRDKTTLWFAIDKTFDKLMDWDKDIRYIAKTNYDDNVEEVITDLNKYYTNQHGSFEDKISDILKLNKGKITYSIVTKLINTFQLSKVKWEEWFYVFGYNKIKKTFVKESYPDKTHNSLVRLSQQLRDDQSTIWFALDEKSSGILEWEKIIQFVARNSFNDDVEATVTDFLKYFINQQRPFLDIINEILTLPKSKINFGSIITLAGIFQMCRDDWDLKYSQ
jgi:hypothetical protein